MKAIVLKNFGGPEQFQVGDMPRPTAARGQVLVRVRAASVKPRRRRHPRGRAMGRSQTPPAILGYDVAGVVEAVGEGVTEFDVGDEVFYTPDLFQGVGANAEYHVADASIVEHKPRNLSFEQAAALPLAGGTAWDALVTRTQNDRLRHRSDRRRRAGSASSPSRSPRPREPGSSRWPVRTPRRPKKAGADLVLSYRDSPLEKLAALRNEGMATVLFDTVGGTTLVDYIPFLLPAGRAVGIVFSVAGDWSQAFFRNIEVHFLFLQRARYKLTALKDLAEKGQLVPFIDRVLPMEQTAEAPPASGVRRLEGQARPGGLCLIHALTSPSGSAAHRPGWSIPRPSRSLPWRKCPSGFLIAIPPVLAHHAVPRQTVLFAVGLQHPHDGAGSPGEPGPQRHLSVAHHGTPRGWTGAQP